MSVRTNIKYVINDNGRLVKQRIVTKTFKKAQRPTVINNASARRKLFENNKRAIHGYFESKFVYMYENGSNRRNLLRQFNKWLKAYQLELKQWTNIPQYHKLSHSVIELYERISPIGYKRWIKRNASWIHPNSYDKFSNSARRVVKRKKRKRSRDEHEQRNESKFDSGSETESNDESGEIDFSNPVFEESKLDSGSETESNEDKTLGFQGFMYDDDVETDIENEDSELEDLGSETESDDESKQEEVDDDYSAAEFRRTIEILLDQRKVGQKDWMLYISRLRLSIREILIYNGYMGEFTLSEHLFVQENIHILDTILDNNLSLLYVSNRSKMGNAIYTFIGYHNRMLILHRLFIRSVDSFSERITYKRRNLILENDQKLTPAYEREYTDMLTAMKSERESENKSNTILYRQRNNLFWQQFKNMTESQRQRFMDDIKKRKEKLESSIKRARMLQGHVKNSKYDHLQYMKDVNKFFLAYLPDDIDRPYFSSDAYNSTLFYMELEVWSYGFQKYIENTFKNKYTTTGIPEDKFLTREEMLEIESKIRIAREKEKNMKAKMKSKRKRKKKNTSRPST